VQHVGRFFIGSANFKLSYLDRPLKRFKRSVGSDMETSSH